MPRRFFIGIVYSLLSLLLAVPYVHGQPGVIFVVDGKNDRPVPYAHVCFFPLDGGEQKNSLTGEDGKAPNMAVTRSEVAVSYVGYVTHTDTVLPGQSITLSLDPKVQDINEVVVTAQYAPQRVDQSIYKVKVINSKQIERKAANNLTDLLSSDLSVRISQDGALGASMSLQGLSGEHIKFLVDGVPVIGRMNGNIDISQLNLYNVDHIEIIEGPMSVIYGSNALAGVVNIITKENNNTHIDARANSYVESVGIYNFDGGFSYRMKKHTLSLSGGRNFFDGYSDNDTSRSIRWKPKRQYFADAYYLFSEPNYKAKVSGSLFSEKLQSKGDLRPPYFETAFDSYFLTTRATGKMEASSNWKSGRFLNLVGSYSFYRREKQTYFKDLTTLEEVRTGNAEDQDTTRFHNIMARGTFSKSRPESKLNYQLGLEFNYEIGEGKRITGLRQDMGDYAAFLSVEYQPWKNFLFQPGVRAIYNTKYSAPLIYSFNIKYSFLENYALRASLSRGFRAPSLKELYLFFVDVNHNIQGNEDLTAENSYNANVNFTYSRETSSSFVGADINLFYNHINNSITFGVVEDDLYTYVNLDKYITQGAQFTANHRLYPQLNTRFGAGITGIYNSISEETDELKKFYYSPNLVASMGYRWMKYDVEFNADYKFTGRLPRVELTSSQELVEGYIESYHMLDVNVGKTFFREVLGLSAGVKNLLDVTTIPSSTGASAGSNGTAHSGGGSGSVPIGWGRTFFIRATINFRKI